MSSHKGILINLSMSLKTQLRMFGKAYGQQIQVVHLTRLNFKFIALPFITEKGGCSQLHPNHPSHYVFIL